MARNNRNLEVLLRSTTPCEAPHAKYPGLNPGSTTLPKGFQKEPGLRAFEAATVFDRDIEIPLRDGIKIRADVFRPVDGPKVPALLAWSPYGKSGAGFFNLDAVPGRVGISPSQLSGMEKFEGLDPAEWVGRGYAVVNVDARGAFDSEGDIRYWGSAEGRDGYDAIEFVANLPWCSGKTALVGNSWLAVAQYFIAAEQPPHLSCIAPWEGLTDLYRESLCRGGVPFKPFLSFLAEVLFGRNKQEDIIAMLEKHPYMNEYWAGKRADLSRIAVPAYILGSFSTALHTAGSFRAFEEIPHNKKWLRVHPTQEWHDLYQPDSVNDLCHFLDRYTKGVENGWEETPALRVSILGFNKDPIVNHVFPSWPIPSTKYQALHLNADNQLSINPPTEVHTQTYQADVPALQVDSDSEELVFTYTFARQAFVVGHSKAVLYMSCSSHDDLDVFVQLRKASADGTILQNVNIPLEHMGVSSAEDIVPVNSNIYLGPTGILRASHRAIDQELSKSHAITYSHTEEAIQKVKPEEIVKLEIAIWPTAMVFEAGEKIILKVAGHHMTLAEFEPLRGAFSAENKGHHVVHFGGRYPSHIEIPIVDL